MVSLPRSLVQSSEGKFPFSNVLLINSNHSMNSGSPNIPYTNLVLLKLWSVSGFHSSFLLWIFHPANVSVPRLGRSDHTMLGSPAAAPTRGARDARLGSDARQLCSSPALRGAPGSAADAPLELPT